MSVGMVTVEQLIAGLNTDLAHEYQAIITYITYAATVRGVHRQELREFFEAEIPDELRHAQFLAQKVAALGGQPVVEPASVPAARTPREMLERILQAEEETIRRYTERLKQAEAYGDYGLANDLQDIISDETRHKEETQKLLAGEWTW